MAQLNTTSNLQGADTRALLGSFYPLNSLQTEANEVFGNNPKQPTKPFNSAKVSANSSVGAFNVKRLSDLLEPQENMSKTNMKGTLSETFNMTSFHSPTHSTLQTKSIRQKISNMKPAGSNFTITREETNPIKSIDSTGIPLDRFTRDSTSPLRETSPSNLARQMIEIQVPIRSSQGSPPKENLDQKMKQISTIYRNQSILDHLRKSRAGLNTSKTDLHPHSQSRNYFGQVNKAAWRSSAGFASNGLVTNNADDSSKIIEPSRNKSTGTINKEALLNSKHIRNSCAKIASHGSFIYPDMNISKKSCQTKYAGSFTNANNSANSSFHSYAKDINPSSQNNISMEKTGVISGNLISQFLCGENNCSEINRKESIESKLEGLLVNKSVEPQNMEEINLLFDNFIDVVCENRNLREPQKVRSMIRKIKLAYGIFFQNYSHSQNKKHAQAKECQQKLEDDCEILELKLNEMNIELQNLQKENEKLVLQNKLPKIIFHLLVR